jgi:hypothetical protein
MLDIMKFFKSIYNYISSKLRFPNSTYENINDTIINDNNNNNDIYDEEYEIYLSENAL